MDVGRAAAELKSIVDFHNDDRPLSRIFILLQYLSKIQIRAYFYVDMVKIGRSATKFLRIIDFQNGGRPPSWIWYDVIADHPRFVFEGPNILLKLHYDRVYTWQDMVIFYIWPVWKITYSRHFWGVLGILSANVSELACNIKL